MSIFNRHPHPPPNPTFLASAHFVDEKGAPYVGYSASLWVDTQGILFTPTDVQGRASWWITNQYEGWGAQLSMSKEVDSPQLFTERIPTLRDRPPALPYGLGNHVIQSAPPIPAPKSRDEILSVNITFQGLTVPTVQYGVLPWFEAALPWMTKADRDSAYRVKHAAGDTHSMAGLPTGGPLYDEPNQPYSADRFGPLDWTNGMTEAQPQFVDLIVEQILEGFTPLVFFDERQEMSFQSLRLAIPALQHNVYGIDLVPYVVIIPGFDGVFFGWDPLAIQQWAQLARSMAPNCNLGLEHNTGHIPLGEGPSDYEPGGKMVDFDLVLSEYDNWDPNVAGSAGDGVWQVNGRLDRPYNRPSDQPHGDDPNPPFYLAQPSVRGPYYHCGFEMSEYQWVRGYISVEDVEKQRAYLKAMGCRWTG